MIFDKRIGKLERRRKFFPPLAEMTEGQFLEWVATATNKQLDRFHRVTTAALRGCTPAEVPSLEGMSLAELDALIAGGEAELAALEAKMEQRGKSE